MGHAVMISVLKLPPCMVRTLTWCLAAVQSVAK
jgi:hypothetical protein